jgi:phage baseplate assembly protein W
MKIAEYSAIALPFSISRGKVVETTDVSKIWRDRVFLAVGTLQGERVLRSDFGSTLPKHSFDATSKVSSVANEEIFAIFTNQFPALILEEVTTKVDTNDGNYYINILYTLPNQTQDTVRVGVAAIDGDSQIREVNLLGNY